MAERPRSRAREAGFTLTEMLVALSILMFGLTALAGSMTVGVSTRRGSEMRFRAIHMVDSVFRDVTEDYLQQHDPGQGPLPPVGNGDVPGYPGLRYTVQFAEDPDDPVAVLATVRISWLEQGEEVAETFERVLIRETPYSRRIAKIVGGRR